MNDPVERQDVIEFLCDWICAPGVRCNESSDKCGCIRGIKALPSAQPEIIRCKDCKYWHNAPVSDGYDSCEKDALLRHDDFFCAEAERREF